MKAWLFWGDARKLHGAAYLCGACRLRRFAFVDVFSAVVPLRRLSHGQCDGESAPATETRAHRDRPAMRLGDPLTDSQPQTEPAALRDPGAVTREQGPRARAVRPPEPLEDVCQVGGGNPN